MAKKTYLFFVVIMFSGISLFAQSELSVEKIMRDPVWMGSFPENPRWSEDSRYIYFERNPENNPYNSVYKYDVESGETTQLSIEEEKKLIPRSGDVNRDKSLKVFTKSGDLHLMNMKDYSVRQLTNTSERESNPRAEDEAPILLTNCDKRLLNFVFTSNREMSKPESNPQ